MSRVSTINRTYSANGYRHSSAHTVRIRKAVQRKSRSRFMVVAALCVAAGILFGMLLSPAQTSKASMSSDVQTCYTSIRVEQGMTLHAIADKYNTASVMSDREYIREVQALNNVYDDRIQAGCYLTIPYYE